MPNLQTRRLWMVVLTCALFTALAVERPTAQSTLRSQYWSTAGNFPETDRLRTLRPVDFGIAFSGGGTRSAAAVLGQLRALHELKWLESVRYMSAASGGAWGAVPYAFSS